MKVIRHHAVGQELHARKPRDAPDEVHKPRALLVAKKERTMGDTTDQVIAPVRKVCCHFLLTLLVVGASTLLALIDTATGGPVTTIRNGRSIYGVDK